LVNAEPIVALAVQHTPILLPAIPTAAAKEDCVKVRLSFLTDEPKHVRSQMLQRLYAAKAPFIEDICVMMPRMQVFAILETFIPAFERLQEADIVPRSANLLSFKVLDEDLTTLAYLFE